MLCALIRLLRSTARCTWHAGMPRGMWATGLLPAKQMAAFVSAAPVAVKAAAPVRLARSAAPASVAARRNVRMQATFKVTLVTPEGTKEISCADDVYVLDAAEVRPRWVRRRAGAAFRPLVGPPGSDSSLRLAPHTEARVA